MPSDSCTGSNRASASPSTARSSSIGYAPNVERNLEAFRVSLDEADMAALDVAFPIGCAAGLRYPESMTGSLGREAPPAGG